MKKGTKGITTERWQESPLKKAGEIASPIRKGEIKSSNVPWLLRGGESSL